MSGIAALAVSANFILNKYNSNEYKAMDKFVDQKK